MNKTCALIYNPNASGFTEKTFLKIKQAILDNGYIPVLLESPYRDFMVENIAKLNEIYDVILTMGGDGTVSNAYKAFSKLNGRQKALYGHIPSGTTNDMGPNTNTPRYNPVRSTKLLLHGKLEKRDIITINGHTIAYVAAGGILAPATYLIDKSNFKKDVGTLSYIRYGIKQFFSDPELYRNIVDHPYKLTYEANGQRINTNAVFFAIFNAKSFANLPLNPNANMCDGKFNVAIIPSASNLFKSLIQGLMLEDGIMSTGQHIFTTDSLTITFNDKVPYYPINCDGDAKDLLEGTNKLDVKPAGKVLQLVGRTYKKNE